MRIACGGSGDHTQYSMVIHGGCRRVLVSDCMFGVAYLRDNMFYKSGFNCMCVENICSSKVKHICSCNLFI
jgi:hypothetical protein